MRNDAVTSATPAMIAVRHLSFDYPGVSALDDVSFEIPPGEVAALVGPNGAGKTTLLRCLAAIDQPITGEIRIDGLDVLARPRECHRRLGFVADFFGLFPELTVAQSLHYLARAHGLAPEAVAPAVRTAARRLQIDDRLDQKAKTLSRGLAQRLAIAQAIVHQPKVLLLDEPAAGLDPEARSRLSELILALQADGMTLIVSSHILAELEEYATSMLIVRGGKLIEQQSLGRSDAQLALLGLRVSEPVADLPERMAALPGVSQVMGDERAVVFQFAADKAAQATLLKTLIGQDVPVCAFGEERTNLQEVYLESLGKSAGEVMR